MTARGAVAGAWLPRWRAGHAWVAVALVVTAVVVAAGPGVWPGLAAQVVVLVVAVAAFGVPHGALDPLVGRRWLAQRLGPRWWLAFHSAYLGLVAAVVAAWAAAPGATLAAFLAASAVHFGLGDVARARAAPGLWWAEVAVRGSAPIAVPALAHADLVRQAFGWVAPGAAAGTLDAIVAGAAWGARWVVLPGCAAAALWHGARAWRTLGARGAHAADAAESLAVPVAAAVLPPFVAFLLYFCVLHSARHALALAAALDPCRPGRAWARFARAALPATAATLALGLLVWLALWRGPAPHPASVAAVRVLFAGLAALTAPHMLLTALAGEEDSGTP